MTVASIPDLPVRAGDVLGGKYRLEQALGEGGMGVVFVAEHADLRERVAVKVLHPKRATDTEIVARFMREGRTAVRIRSEHVARVTDVGMHAVSGIRLPYIVMELLEGEDLAHRIDQGGPIALAAAIDLVLQTCEALAAAHALGVVHRDLKPSNLFLVEGPDGAPFVKVLDFGISKVTDGAPDSSRAVTTTSDVLGSPGYMSPEQMRATRDVDARSDVWSLGMILWEMLVGAPMFAGATFPEICAKVLNGDLVALSARGANVPQELERIVMRALALEPSDRWPTVLAFAEALTPWIAGDAKPRLARIANLSRPPSGRRPSTPSWRPAAVGSEPTAPATPSGDAPIAMPTTRGEKMATPRRETQTPEPWDRDARASSGRWPYVAIGAALLAAALVWAVGMRARGTEVGVAAATATASAPASASASASAPAPASAFASASVSVAASAGSAGTPARASATAARSAAPPSSVSAARPSNGAPILR